MLKIRRQKPKMGRNARHGSPTICPWNFHNFKQSFVRIWRPTRLNRKIKFDQNFKLLATCLSRNTDGFRTWAAAVSHDGLQLQDSRNDRKTNNNNGSNVDGHF
jgi:hypothetical protein